MTDQPLPNYGKAMLYLSFLCNAESDNIEDLQKYRAKTIFFFGSLLICAAIQSNKIDQ